MAITCNTAMWSECDDCERLIPEGEELRTEEGTPPEAVMILCEECNDKRAEARARYQER